MSNTSEALNAAPATRPRVLLVAGSWFLTFAVAFAIAAASFLLGVYVVSRDLASMRQLIQTLQSEAQKSKQALIASTGANIRYSMKGFGGRLKSWMEFPPTEMTTLIAMSASVTGTAHCCGAPQLVRTSTNRLRSVTS